VNVCTRAAPLAAALLVAALAGPTLLAAQRRVPIFWGAISGAAVTARSAYANASAVFKGPAFAGEGGVAWGRLSLHVGYGEGSLRADTGGRVLRRDYVEGFAFFGGTPLERFEVVAGPRARAYATDARTERWLFWELHSRYEAPIVGSLISGYAELWGALGGSVNVVEAFRSEWGGAAAILIRPRSAPLTVGLRYSIDEARLRDARRETVEGLTFTVRYSSR
jgi:hypothetical protein